MARHGGAWPVLSEVARLVEELTEALLQPPVFVATLLLMALLVLRLIVGPSG